MSVLHYNDLGHEERSLSGEVCYKLKNDEAMSILLTYALGQEGISCMKKSVLIS